VEIKTTRMNGWAVLADFAGALGLALAGGVAFSLVVGGVVLMLAGG
jgi:hypothetical protein